MQFDGDVFAAPLASAAPAQPKPPKKQLLGSARGAEPARRRPAAATKPVKARTVSQAVTASTAKVGGAAASAKKTQALAEALASPLLTPTVSQMSERLPSQVLRLGADFSGYGSDSLALRALGIPHKVSFVCESCPRKRALHEALHGRMKSRRIYKDAASRDPESMPDVDLLVSGAPCPPWSSAGKQKGLQDVRGSLLFKSLAYARAKRPRCVVLENVKGLTFKKNAPVLAAIIRVLKTCGYRVWRRVVNTRQHGIPQSRPRLYIVGIQSVAVAHKFHFPKPVPCAELGRFLRRDVPDSDVPPLRGRALKHVQRARRKTPNAVGLVVDTGASKRFASAMVGCSPCLTKSRSRGYFLVDHNRYMTVHEMGGLQGLGSSWIDRMLEVESSTFIGSALGDAMSVNVLSRVLARALYSAGLVPSLPTDVWARVPAAGRLPDALLDVV